VSGLALSEPEPLRPLVAICCAFAGQVSGLLVPDPVKAPIVRRIFHLYAKGKLGTTAIGHTLEAEGAPAPRKHGWSPNALQLILTNPAYRGLIRWNGEIHAGLHEPLVDDEVLRAGAGDPASPRRGRFAAAR
jgi:hypothetical protein